MPQELWMLFLVAVMMGNLLLVTCQEIKEVQGSSTFSRDLRLVWAGSPQKNKDEPRRIKKTFSFLSIY